MDTTTHTNGVATQTQADANTQGQEQKTFSADYVKELREENKSWRIRLSEVEKSLQSYQEKEKQIQEQEAIKRGEFEKLLSEKESSLQALRKELESLKPIAEEYNKIKLSRKDELLAKLPEHVKEDFKTASIEEIERAVKLLPSAQVSPSVASGQVYAPSQNEDITKLTQEQLEQIRVQNPTRFSEIIKQLFKM